MNRTALVAAGLACAVAAAPLRGLAQGHAHQHGVARLDIAVEATRLTIQLDSPLDNLLGFERAPRTAAEHAAVDAALRQLRDAARMFAIDPAAGCRPGAVELASAALKLGQPASPDEEAGHADIDASFGFDCTDAARATFVDVGLFRFARLQRLQVQVATPRGQFRRDVGRPAVRISLVR